MYEIKDDTLDFEKPEGLAFMIKRLGNPESTTLLHSPCRVFQIPEVDGAIGYYQIQRSIVVVGDPICLPQDLPKLTKAFHLYCQKQNLKTVYLLVSEEFAHWAIDNGCHTLIQVGSELNIDPTQFQIKRKLRWSINQSIQADVAIKEYKGFDPLLENQMKHAIRMWLKQRRGPQIHLGAINFFNPDVEKRIFYAIEQDKIVGVLMLTPLDRFQGWVVSSYLTTFNAPVGTTEHLMCTVFKTLAGEQCHFLCLGAISGKEFGEIIGLNLLSKFSAGVILKVARKFFKLDAKAQYLKKYRPYARPTFLLCREKLTFTQLLALKKVLNVKL